MYVSQEDRLKEALHIFHKSYHTDFYALKNVTFSIKKGEVVGILGKNGSGKSTLLKIITGVLTQESGDVKVSGNISAILELGSGFNPELTGLQNLYFSANIYGFKKEEIEEKIEQISTFADIGEFLYQPLKTYSSGMKARLGFAFAIHSKAEILIIDEALSVGDAAFVRKCYAKIEEVCQDTHTTVLFVSHSEAAIKQLCSRAILLHKGELVVDGSAKDVVNLYNKLLVDENVIVGKYRKEFNAMNSKVERKNSTIAVSLDKYDPNLVSKSRVELLKNGAMIFDVGLLDRSNEKVNILTKNEEYVFVYKVIFEKDYDFVNVAMRIKNLQGILITGEARELHEVKKKKVYKVSFIFKNILNHGEYFFNAGVNTTINGEFIMLHRIIDVYMIKSKFVEKSTAKAMVDFNMTFKVETQ